MKSEENVRSSDGENPPRRPYIKSTYSLDVQQHDKYNNQRKRTMTKYVVEMARQSLKEKLSEYDSQVSSTQL